MPERHERVRPTLVRGHAGHAVNERADRLAVEAAVDAQPRQEVPVTPGQEQLGLDV